MVKLNNKYDAVISGLGGKFPECCSVAEFQQKLFSKDVMLNIDTRRWNPAKFQLPLTTGRLMDVDQFDASFFGVPRALVNSAEPMLGLILERGFEAMIDAGVNPFAMKGHNVSVITATSLSDAEPLRYTEAIYLEGMGMIGLARTMLANRLSFFFNFVGPSYNMNSSWTSAMDGLQKAATMVSDGTVEAALVISSNRVDYDAVDVEYRDLNLLSSDGKCSPFDAEANGFARSEGVVAFYVQRAQDAKRHYCSVEHAQSVFTGNKGHFLQISPEIDEFYKEFYNNCNINPSDIAYLETNVFCKEIFDADILNSIANVHCTSEDSKLLIGSIVGNVGCSEPVSGFFSLVKVITAMETGLVPPTVHYHTPNPRVPALLNGQLKPVVEASPLNGDYVTVNCLNLIGNVSKVIVKRNAKAKTCIGSSDTLPRLVTLQARDEEGIRAIVNKVNSLPTDVEFVSLVNGVFRTTIPPYLWRGFTILPADESKVDRNMQVFEPTKRPVWFIFSGMGSQWSGMGRDLMRLPLFAAAIDKCDKMLRPRGIDIRHIITSDDRSILDNILNCFVGIAAIQIGLVDIMRILGVSPDGMIGHSVGELGCAYADGCLTAEEMVLAAYSRGKASLEANYDDIGGMMAAVGLGYNDIKDRLPESLDVACHNAEDSCTLSGPEEDVLQYVGQLKQQGVFAKAVSAGGIAYHSRYIRSVAPKLRQYLKEVIPNPQPRSTKWICSSVPQNNWESEETRLCSAEYHTNNLLNPVLFEEACKYIPKNAIVIEIAPHGLLQAILKRGLSRDSTIISLATRFSQSNLNHLLNAVGQLYLNNVEVDVNSLYPPVGYPVSRGTPGMADLVTWYHGENSFKWYSNSIAKLLRQGIFEKNIAIDEKCVDFKLWKEYCMDDRVVVPFAQLLIYAWKVWIGITYNKNKNTCFVVENAAIIDCITVDGKDKYVNVTVLPVSFNFQVALCGSDYPETTILLTGKLCETDPWHYEAVNYIQADGNAEVITQEEVYRLFENFGIHLGKQFQCIKHMSIGKTGCFALVRWGGNLVPFIDSLVKIVVFIKMDEEQTLLLPSHIQKLVVNMDALSKLSDGAEVEVFYDKVCDTLVCEGVQLCGLTLRPVVRQQLPCLVWQETKFQPYFEEMTSVDGFLAAVLQLVASSELGSWKGGSSHICVLKIRNDAPVLNLETKDRLDISPFISVHHLEVDLTEAETLLSSGGRENYLVVGELSSIITLAQYVQDQQPVYFLAESSAQMLRTDETINPVMTCKTKYHNVALLKKTQHPTQSASFEATGSNWLSGLRQVMKETEHTVVVYSRGIPARHMLPILAKEHYAHRLRTIFLVGESSATFSAKSSVYFTILSLNLPINILSKGIWGFLTFVNADIVPIEPKFDILNDLPIWRNNNGVDVDSIGLNATHPSVRKGEKFEIKCVDYSGYHNTRRIMGIAELDHERKTMRVDPILRWTVPNDWTMEEAASVPVIYALAYYCVSIKGDLSESDFVLINDGLSLPGQAAISITLELGGDIITSVKDEEEIKILIKLFPKLRTSQVMVLGVHDVNIFVRKLTQGKGVKLVINPLKNNEMLSSFRAMGYDGRFLHLGHVDMEMENGLGMNTFLRRTSFYGISVRSLFDCNSNVKVNLQKVLQRGIDKGVVKPLRSAVFSIEQQVVALRTFENDHLKLKIVMTNKTRGNPQLASLISGNTINDISLIAGTKGQLWLDVAEWLVRRGIRRLIVLTEEDSSITESNLRIFNKLNRRYGAILRVHSMSQIKTLDSCKDLIKQILDVGVIKSIFTIGLNEESVQLKNLDAASREAVPAVRHFVSLLGEGAAVSESRARSGLAVCHVQSSSALQQPALVLPYLSALLDQAGPAARFLTVRDKDTSTFTTGIIEFQDILPSSVEELYQLSKNISDPPLFTEVATLSPGYYHLKENLLPIFVVSGLYSTRLDSFLRGLQYPAFCCKLPLHTDSIEHLAEVLCMEVLRVKSQGPYNIVGDTWGGPAALALSCLLEARGHQVELFLIEGAPPTLRTRVQALCNQYNTDLGTSLLTNLLSLPPKVVENVVHCQRWERKMALGLEHVSENIRNSVGKALTSLYSQLSAVQLSDPPAQLFKGIATLFTCRQTCPADLAKLTQYCMQSPISIPTGSKNHQSLLSDSHLLNVVNENVRYDWRM